MLKDIFTPTVFKMDLLIHDTFLSAVPRQICSWSFSSLYQILVKQSFFLSLSLSLPIVKYTVLFFRNKS